MEEEYTLESVKEAIRNIHQTYPPEKRTDKVKELLEELYAIEQELNSKSTQDTE